MAYLHQSDARANQAQWSARNPVKTRARRLWQKAKHRAAASGCEFSITEAWVREKLQAGRCEASGVNLDMRTGEGYLPFAPSLDQKIAGLGYTPENARVVAYLYNIAKHTWSDEVAQNHLRILVTALTKQLG